MNDFHTARQNGGSLGVDRRGFLRRSVAAIGGAAAMPLAGPAERADDAVGGLVADIEREVVFHGRKTRTTWFHPRPCMVPASDGVEALMTLQTIGGSDYFGPVHYTISRDGARSWSEPQPIPGLGRRKLDAGYEVGVCDVVPEYHQPTQTVLAIGHNVYYRNGRLARPQRARWPVYVVRSADGTWSAPRRLKWDDLGGSAIYTCGCAQRVTLEGGDLLVPLSFAPQGRTHRSVATVRCAFDGQQLVVRKVGAELIGTAGRGLLEPSLAALDRRFYMTIRAEDNRGYVTVSDDALTWEPRRPWAWEDGEPLTMSTTQQRWLVHSDSLLLVYTRKAEDNVNVFRWRSPLLMAEVDRRTLRLIRATERVVFPLVGDGVEDPDHVARMGNFHTVAATPAQSWVTVGETLPNDGWAGNTLLARVCWSRANRLAPLALAQHRLGRRRAWWA
ncbi:MAG: exo-alpha-sialidase [Pirellulales bacterium]|nr:exo-alpha-sialidase [Pirellulales bacterium]